MNAFPYKSNIESKHVNLEKGIDFNIYFLYKHVCSSQLDLFCLYWNISQLHLIRNGFKQSFTERVYISSSLSWLTCKQISRKTQLEFRNLNYFVVFLCIIVTKDIVNVQLL